MNECINYMKLKHKLLAISLGQSRKYVMCSRKSKLGEIAAQGLAEQYKQRAYECPICGWWHLTKKVY